MPISRMKRIKAASPIGDVVGGEPSACGHDHTHEGASLNATQERVRRILANSSTPLSAYEVLDQMRHEGSVTPPTVYRALDKLITTGLAHRLESLNAYIVCEHPHHHHVAAFAICEACGLVREFTDSGLDERLKLWSEAQKFQASRTTVELRGRCAACS